MEPTLTWKVTKIYWDEKSGGVSKARWTLFASQDGYEGYVKGQTSFSPDPSNEKFIPLENLTEEVVLSWIKNNVINKKGLEKLAINRMKEKIPSSKDVSGLPWEVS